VAFKEDIMKQLGVTNEKMIPKVVGNYKIEPGRFNLHPQDIGTFQELFAAGTNKGVGNGEVSLFWLFNWGRRSGRAIETRGGNDPDLKIDSKNVEVKAYPKHGKFSLGRFQDQRAFRELISTIFSVDNILREKGFTDVANFKYKDMVRASESFCKLRQVILSNKQLNDFDFFKKLIKTIDRFESLATQEGLNSVCYTGSNSRPGGEKIAMELSKYILRKLLGGKPGNGGFMLNLVPDSSKKFLNLDAGIMIYKIDLDRMETSADILGSESPQTFTFNGGAFSANFEKLFGKIR
jgi:hypothetical protein